ncbi:MAG: hypothetical protein DRO13_05120 [Thermoprotei archaeon]|nr:MAG: hypothetical protein DRO13_05120 [Thermoprotei archaeon]
MDGDEQKPVVIIEHLEDTVGIWLFLEYRHSSLIYGSKYIWFTNLPEKYHAILSKYGRVSNKSTIDLVRGGEITAREVLILDPQAEKSLDYYDLVTHRYVVIGGILGDNPPRGRTKKLLTDKLENVEARNIGDGQYSIDGSVYYVDYLWRHRSLAGYSYVDGISIETRNGSIHLPFRYPLVEGKPLLAPGLLEYLREGRVPSYILREIGLA